VDQLLQHVFKLFPKILMAGGSRSVIGLCSHWKDCAKAAVPDCSGTCPERQGKTMTFIVGFEVLTAVSTKMAVFWFVAPCSLVEV
jgi:hypothetical protein